MVPCRGSLRQPPEHPHGLAGSITMISLFGWLVADSWCWFVLREEYCWLVAGGWFVVRESYCWLVADKPSEQGDEQRRERWSSPLLTRPLYREKNHITRESLKCTFIKDSISLFGSQDRNHTNKHF
jgi:hypothetical protein